MHSLQRHLTLYENNSWRIKLLNYNDNSMLANDFLMVLRFLTY